MSAVARTDFKSACRQWRQFRKLSQLQLALAADVSQRHVSWLETGRSQPSREMVLRLSAAMDVPLRDTNVLLQSAGFAAAYNESQLDDPAMAPVHDALNRVLQHHDPLPALVVDRLWNVRMLNSAAERFLGMSADLSDMLARIGSAEPLNLALVTLHPKGLRQFVANWDQAAPSFVRRLKNEALVSADPAVQAQLASYIEMAGPLADSEPVLQNLLPVLPLELRVDGVRLSLFSVISTFGTPQDITTDELRIEAFYPTNAETSRFFTSLKDR